MGKSVCSTSHPFAAQAGLRTMQMGGNAVDAAIATAAALCIVEPVSNGLGSDCFAIVWDGKELHGLNASGHSPKSWSFDYFEGKYGLAGNDEVRRPMRGWDTVTVPGAVAGWQALHSKWGSRSLDELLGPAIEIAEHGYAVPPIVASKWQASIQDLQGQPGFQETFMPHGRAPRIGELFRFQSAAKTLRQLCSRGLRDYYEGETAQALVNHSAQNGGSLSQEDLSSYLPEWVEPIGQMIRSQDQRSYKVYEIPPNGQGIAALMAFGILEEFNLGQFPVDSGQAQHLQIEAMKLAFADVYAHLSDQRSMRVSVGDLLDPHYLRSRAQLIRHDRAMVPSTGLPDAGGTVYLTTADKNGMMVSFIQSNYMGFGSGVVVPQWGISLQNRGYGFSPQRRSSNCIEPSKRPFHTIIPAFLMRVEDGVEKPQMSFGVMGGDMQPQGHLQTLLRMLKWGQQPQAACDAPRWKINRDYTLDIEGRADPELVQNLKQRGHSLKRVDDPYMDFGSGQFIWRLSDEVSDGYVAASDSRRDGQASAY
jgi:gamma-glutamyltranspeptidase/glutathione hydrolase